MNMPRVEHVDKSRDPCHTQKNHTNTIGIYRRDIVGFRLEALEKGPVQKCERVGIDRYTGATKASASSGKRLSAEALEKHAADGNGVG